MATLNYSENLFS